METIHLALRWQVAFVLWNGQTMFAPLRDDLFPWSISLLKPKFLTLTRSIVDHWAVTPWTPSTVVDWQTFPFLALLRFFSQVVDICTFFWGYQHIMELVKPPFCLFTALLDFSQKWIKRQCKLWRKIMILSEVAKLDLW